MGKISIVSRNSTTFTRTMELDEDAFRASLQRYVDAEIAVYLASGGSGEASALTIDELRRVYEIGVEVYQGRLPVYANIPEVKNAQEAIDLARLAIDANVDGVNIYGPASLHGYVPTDAELTLYFDTVLGAVEHPTVLAPNPIQGYTPKPSVVAAMCDSYPHVTAVNLVGLAGDSYFLELRELIKRDDVALAVPLPGSHNLFDLGASALVSNLCTILPKTIRQYVDRYEGGDDVGMGKTYADLLRFERYVRRWPGARWQKMAMRVLKLPGGEGGLRLPYLMPPNEEVEQFARGLLALNIPELDDLAQAAGLA
jgi:dihydrodipicolinate synthase/N-acetylneuraminate lyase